MARGTNEERTRSMEEEMDRLTQGRKPLPEPSPEQAQRIASQPAKTVSLPVDEPGIF